MDRAALNEHDRIETVHWWFRARRRIILARLSALLGRDPRRLVVEVGCATGGNLAELARRYRAIGMEPDAIAAGRAREKSGAEVRLGRLPDDAEMIPEEADAVLLLDVLEHVERDDLALSAVAARMKPGALLLVTVPAYPALYAPHDVALGHRRRYTARTLRGLLEGCGFGIERLTYFNTLLLPPALLVRVIRRWRRRLTPRTDFTVPSRPVNWLLETLFALERHVLRVTNLPIGLGILAEARRRGS